MITFYEGEELPVLESLNSKDCTFGEMKDSIKKQWYLEFNNSGIFSRKANKMFLDLGINSIESF